LGISIISAVLGVIGGGWYINEYRPRQEVVIRVNDTAFNMGYFINILKDRLQAYELFYSPGQSPLYMQSVANEVEGLIQSSELFRQEAAELGFVISDGELDEEFQARDPRLSREYRDIVRAEMLLSRLRDEYFEQQVPNFAEQRNIIAMFLESESQTRDVIARLEAGEDFGELAGELSLETLSQTENGDLGWHPKGILTGGFGLSVPEDYAFASEVTVLSAPLHDEARTKRVGYWLVKLLGRDEDEQGELFNLQVMLLTSEEEAQEIIARLEAGEDFGELAGELSQETSSQEDGGDLGWLNPDEISPLFENFILDAEPGALSGPIRDESFRTKGGYWLVKVLGIEESREISDEDREFLKTEALNEWALSLEEDPDNEIVSNLSLEKKAWAIDKALGRPVAGRPQEPTLPQSPAVPEEPIRILE
jgi:parvulin-like peptidyl-prolyl isomerase